MCGCGGRRVFSLCGHKRRDLDDVRSVNKGSIANGSEDKSGSRKVRVCQSWSQRTFSSSYTSVNLNSATVEKAV